MPVFRATIAVILFVIAGVIGGLTVGQDWATALPLIIIYAVLVIDTFFSIRFFAAITPTSAAQNALDGLLAAMYILLALNFAQPTRFMFITATLFGVAVLKYVILYQRNHARTITRKIRIDVLGGVVFLLAAGALWFFPVPAVSWTLVGLNVVANIDVLWRHPLYPRQVAQSPKD